jgi:hypothetical protein
VTFTAKFLNSGLIQYCDMESCADDEDEEEMDYEYML